MCVQNRWETHFLWTRRISESFAVMLPKFIFRWAFAYVLVITCLIVLLVYTLQPHLSGNCDYTEGRQVRNAKKMLIHLEVSNVPHCRHSVWWKWTAVIQHFRNCYNLEQQISYRVSSQMQIYWFINFVNTMSLTLICEIYYTKWKVWISCILYATLLSECWNPSRFLRQGQSVEK